MSGHTAAYVAVSISIISVLSCVIFVPILLGKISEIQSQLRLDMDEFTISSNDVWREIQTSRKTAPAPRTRKTRQAFGGQCQCNEANICPPGSVGPPGDLGMNGEPGKSGLNGEPGLPGTTPPVETTPDGRCRVCPGGSRGPPGPGGPPGPNGGKGEPGFAGRDANDGFPGRQGAPGGSGDSGPDGKNGEDGPAGRPGTSGSKGEAGKPGTDGQPGPKGPPGQPGRAGIPGRPGAPGATGPLGEPGLRADSGVDGFPGGSGPPGEDAQYCPCPRRSAFKRSGETSPIQEVVRSLGGPDGGEVASKETSSSVDYDDVPESERIKIGEKSRLGVPKASLAVESAPKKIVEEEQPAAATEAPWYRPVVSYVTRILSPDEVSLNGRRTTPTPVRNEAVESVEEEEAVAPVALKEEAPAEEGPELIVFPAQKKEEKKAAKDDSYELARESILRRFPDTFDSNTKDLIFKVARKVARN